MARRDVVALIFTLFMPLFLLGFFALVGAAGVARAIPLTVIDLDESAPSAAFVQTLGRSPHLLVRSPEEGSPPDLVLTIPEGFGRVLDGHNVAPATVQLVSRTFDTDAATRAAAAVRTALYDFDWAQRGDRRSTNVEIQTLGPALFAFLVAGLMSMVLCTGVFSGSGGLANLRDAGVLRHLRTTPLSAEVYLTARASAGTVWILIANLPLFAAIAVISPPPASAYPGAVLVLLLGALMFLLLGMLLALLIPSLQAVSRAATMLVLPMIILGEVFFRPGPGWAAMLAEALPLAHITRALRALLAEGQAFSSAAGHLSLPLVWLAVIVGLAVWRARRVIAAGDW
jgi:ABC-2 type transport system permease protein